MNHQTKTDDHEPALMCFDNQIENDLVNYDYADNEEFNPEDNCEFNSRISIILYY